MEIAGLYIFSYLVGAIPTAFLIGKLAKGVDIRGYGSGNVGGGNVFLHVGKKMGGSPECGRDSGQRGDSHLDWPAPGGVGPLVGISGTSSPLGPRWT